MACKARFYQCCVITLLQNVQKKMQIAKQILCVQQVIMHGGPQKTDLLVLER